RSFGITVQITAADVDTQVYKFPGCFRKKLKRGYPIRIRQIRHCLTELRRLVSGTADIFIIGYTKSSAYIAGNSYSKPRWVIHKRGSIAAKRSRRASHCIPLG